MLVFYSITIQGKRNQHGVQLKRIVTEGKTLAIRIKAILKK